MVLNAILDLNDFGVGGRYIVLEQVDSVPDIDQFQLDGSDIALCVDYASLQLVDTTVKVCIELGEVINFLIDVRNGSVVSRVLRFQSLDLCADIGKISIDALLKFEDILFERAHFLPERVDLDAGIFIELTLSLKNLRNPAEDRIMRAKLCEPPWESGSVKITEEPPLN